MANLTGSVDIDWFRSLWAKMAERLEDLICSFDVPVPGFDPLTVLILGWLGFVIISLSIFKLVQYFGKRKNNIIPQSTMQICTDFSQKQSGSQGFVDGLNNAKHCKTDSPEGVDQTFISMVKSAIPFKEAASQRRASVLSKQIWIPQVVDTPIASGHDDDHVQWINNLINYIYCKPDIRHDISLAWLAALNDSATKLSSEAGINLQFVEVQSGSERPQFSNIVVDTGPNDNLTVTADCLARPRLTCRVLYQQDGENRAVSYDTTVQTLRGRLNVSVLTHQNMAIAKLDGWPEVVLDMVLMDEGCSSSLEEQIRQECARDVVAGCLRGAVTDLYFSQYADLPQLKRAANADNFRCTSFDPTTIDPSTGEQVSRRLLVKIIKAAGLAVDRDSVHPFCVVEMDEPLQRFQTDSKPETTQPFWDQSFLFDLSANTAELLFEVFDERAAGVHNFLGLGIVGIDELLVSPSQRQIIPLLSRPGDTKPVTGCITVEFVFVDDTGEPMEEPSHRVALTSERVLSSGEILQTTRTTYTKPNDIADGDFVTSLALNDLKSTAKPNAKKSTLIIHSSKKESTEPPALKVQRNGNGLWVEVSIKNDDTGGATTAEVPDTDSEVTRYSTLPRSTGAAVGPVRRRNTLLGSLRRRLGVKSRSKSTENVPPASPASDHIIASTSRQSPTNLLTVPKSPAMASRNLSGSDNVSVSDMSGVSVGSNRTYISDESTLVLETTENGIVRHFLVPINMAGRQKFRKKFAKLHIYNEHVFVAKHIPSALCAVCEKLLPRWMGKQGYECRDCHMKVHKQCHIRVESACSNATVHAMEMEYMPTLTDRRMRNMTR